ncbi:MAG: hypothetical protein COV74_03065 [Candidatus Omnitrophica bacterium CG11_big_fil_rev_8_21_14_0_20_45_26]|uniref:Phytanoyl-CoA dioxygenase n=1 Tax=Candidatus Abzuiibacterium crystallinum TaxID=1974748 RepID=A0A2H0LR36_9BACT|nr:MAG: hypothetical protein COV74_03065 [Candidatus Omnitrophica bacterium CG11_big_fil_rev_8_21_14_0_20_45_26]PIW64656.1 MAG: hypothetical protein COW12_05090 [Candidatus Omnitrophica bacterium CG12_big_fil_rev_8_21_14_0_65_45_16]
MRGGESRSMIEGQSRQRLLTTQEVTNYHRDGFLVADQALSCHECRHYLSQADTLKCEGGEEYAPIMNPHRLNTAFFSLLKHPFIVSAMGSLLRSQKICALQSMLYFKKPGALGRDVHQDNFYVQAAQFVFGGAWVALDDADQENGCLYAYVGSHQEPILEVKEEAYRTPHPAEANFVNDRGRPCVIPKGYRKVYLPAKAGSVVFMDGNLVHGSELNQSQNRFRRAFIGHYIKEGSSFRSGLHAQREAINVY